MRAPYGGIDMENITWKKSKGSSMDKYAQSKVGNMFLASEFAKRDRSQGIMHVAFNPGNLKSPLQRHVSNFLNYLFVSLTDIHVCYVLSNCEPNIYMI